MVWVGLVNVPLMAAALVALAPPLSPPVTAGADQLYTVPGCTTPFVPLDGVRLKATPLHLVAVIALTELISFTVTVVVALAWHPFASVRVRE